ncbi:RNA-binding domain-containing protein [Atopobium sp. oral taxon 416]|uniref:RNA-binding domain-containing protein n=1 Tax=Atopobium sp. oral taxon 416 TaxID=712157 RepID=UPI001BA702A6|nr:RNA-binding domain-containing protein [Atopobium sp. oral taxon 416]QUC03686.1 putative DNA binding domain-containing protein [Atopobium sp. oral taxon 416]
MDLREQGEVPIAIPINFKELVSGSVVESSRIEAKEDFNPERVVHTICAFANDIDNIGGGYVLIGVAEKNSLLQLPPKGISREQVDSVLKRLSQLCRGIEPHYEPIVEPKQVAENRYVIVIWCPGGQGRPYKAYKNVYKKGSTERLYYIRKMASTPVATSEEERELYYVSSTIPFDDQANLAAFPSDLSLALMRDHLKEIGSSLYEQSEHATLEELADDLQLLSGPPESLRPRNVGILMFSDHIHTYFRYARIEVVDLPDPTGQNMVEKTFTGPIQRQLRDALTYIKNYMLESKIVKFADRAESQTVFNYPYAAVEEILSNAVYHRSYKVSEPITVRKTPDALEITSYPGFDRSIKDSDIQSRNIRGRIYRNRRIGDFLKELHLIEGRNTGFPTTFRALADNGSPMPDFQMDENRNYLSVILHVHPAFQPQESRRDAGRRELEQRILDALPERPVLISELARLLGYKGITKRLRITVDAMLSEGTLRSVRDGARNRIARP